MNLRKTLFILPGVIDDACKALGAGCEGSHGSDWRRLTRRCRENERNRMQDGASDQLGAEAA